MVSALLIGCGEVVEPLAKAGLAPATAIAKPKAETISPIRRVLRNCARKFGT